MTKTKSHHDEDVDVEPEPETKSSKSAKADGPTQLLSPLYNYGPPVTQTGNPANGGAPANTAGSTTVTIAGGMNGVPPANTSGNIGSSGSPSEEVVGLYTPTLASISPTTIAKGSANAAVVCTGTAFFAATPTRAGSTVMVNGSPIPTTYTSATSISGTMSHSTQAAAGTVSVNVSNLGAQSTTPRTFTYT
jgi:hypothetical protein